MYGRGYSVAPYKNTYVGHSFRQETAQRRGKHGRFKMYLHLNIVCFIVGLSKMFVIKLINIMDIYRIDSRCHVTAGVNSKKKVLLYTYIRRLT